MAGVRDDSTLNEQRRILLELLTECLGVSGRCELVALPYQHQHGASDHRNVLHVGPASLLIECLADMHRILPLACDHSLHQPLVIFRLLLDGFCVKCSCDETLAEEGMHDFKEDERNLEELEGLGGVVGGGEPSSNEDDAGDVAVGLARFLPRKLDRHTGPKGMADKKIFLSLKLLKNALKVSKEVVVRISMVISRFETLTAAEGIKGDDSASFRVFHDLSLKLLHVPHAPMNEEDGPWLVSRRGLRGLDVQEVDLSSRTDFEQRGLGENLMVWKGC
mmetsp:Transcript_16376/g.54830  ORF Transcript_16376/g.54830 Transcript_16376/m.54830 type:complete len:277 (-) Transcript_16376:183-1013(-)